MKLTKLFLDIADALNGPLAIEQFGASELRKSSDFAEYSAGHTTLESSMIEVLLQKDADPVCNTISEMNLLWQPPTTSNDPAYIAASKRKVHVELLGPKGLVQSDVIRLGLYGMYPNSDYGIRTHPAEEIFVMLAGEALWKRGSGDYLLHRAGERSHHPSMLPHANKTANKAFMSVYVWAGDISTDNYVYQG